MICPALEEGQMFVDVLLPKASNWYYFYTGERYNVTSDPPVITLPAPLDEVIVFARGGI
jgi:alpha-glucosidase (family GH31 glycosyl hydrolase)